MDQLNVISVREVPEEAERFIAYFILRWANAESEAVYRDCILSCLKSDSRLPQWYLLVDEANEIIGGAGLISNDFISRMDLTPWLCALYIEEQYRGHAYGSLLIEHIRKCAASLGFEQVYLCTDHVGYYEKYRFEYVGAGYHPWGDISRIYKTSCLSS